MPAYAIDESNGCISDVLWNLRKRFEMDFQVSGSVAAFVDFRIYLLFFSSCG
jgi:hypothetical protein